jgi:hypothetical protein
VFAFEGHADLVRGFALTPGDQVLSASFGDSLKLWNLPVP